MNRSETRFRSCSPLRHRAFTIQGEDSGHDYLGTSLLPCLDGRAGSHRCHRPGDGHTRPRPPQAEPPLGRPERRRHHDSAVLWARSDGPGRLVAEISSGHRSWYRTGRIAGADSDFTAKLDLAGLAPGREYQVDLWFEDQDGLRGEIERARFSTASMHPSATSFVWTGDTSGQGWGINHDIGGMRGYAAMHATRPDFFLHSGDTIYADGPIAEQVTEPDGQVWRNLVTEEVQGRRDAQRVPRPAPLQRCSTRTSARCTPTSR